MATNQIIENTCEIEHKKPKIKYKDSNVENNPDENESNVRFS